MISDINCPSKKYAAVLVFVALSTNCVQFSNATIVVISKTTNETVFSTEEIGIDAASAYNLMGNLVIADPIDACSEVKPPPGRNHTIIVGAITGQQLHHKESWILWAVYNYTDDDTCSLSRKAKEAEYAGYSAIVITVLGTNDTQGILPSFMGFDWMGVGVYTSILGESMGNTLRKYAYPRKYYLEFENEPYFQLGLLVNFVFLGCLGIVMVVLLLRLSHCLYMRVSSSVIERRRKRKAFLTESQLKKLPVLHWRTSIPQDTCSICIENFEVGEEIRVLPCSHVFHKPCIDPWLIHSSRRCPNCKGKVIFPNEHFSDSSNSDTDSHLDDSDDEFLGNERTPLLRASAGESDDQIEDTRFVESQNNTQQTVGQSSTCSNALINNAVINSEQGHSKETADLIDVSSDSEQISDESFGSFQSAHTTGKDEAMLINVDCSQSLASAKSFDSEKTFVGHTDLSRKSSQSGSISRKNDDYTSSMGSNASFFSCLESELEKSTSSNSHHELFQSFQS